MTKKMTVDEIVNDVHKTILKEWATPELEDFFLQPWITGDVATEQYHFNLGMQIRNHYDLWSIPWVPEMRELHGILCDCSPFHPDAISNTIIKKVWAKGMGSEPSTPTGVSSK